jgi:hypothetical protein
MDASLIASGPHRAVLRADVDGDALRPPRGVGVLPHGVDVQPGEGFQTLELDALALLGVLDARGAQVVEDDGHEVLRLARLLGGNLPVHVLVGGEDAVGREALHGEGAGDAHRLVVLVGLVVEQLGVGGAGDAGVDLLLTLAPRLPPGRMQRRGLLWPRSAGRTGNLPLCPVLAQQPVQFAGQPLQFRLPARMNRVDLGVVGDGLERDVRHALVDEALADIAGGGQAGRRLPAEFRLFPRAGGRIGQQVIGIAGGHEAGARQGDGDAAGVHGDPAPAPTARRHRRWCRCRTSGRSPGRRGRWSSGGSVQLYRSRFGQRKPSPHRILSG